MNPTNSEAATPSGSLAYLKAGSGPPLVIVHGIGGHKEDWLGLMEALADRRTTYAVDMIGFGGSSKDAAEITIATQVAAIIALLDADGIARADILGNSVGGWVAATLAAEHPDRVKQLVLVDAAGFKAMFEGPPPVEFYPAEVAGMEKLLAHVLHSDFAHSRSFAEQALGKLKASGEMLTAERVFNGLFVSPRLEDLMPRIAAPTLVMWGAEDKLFPPAIADLVQGGVVGASKVLIPQASHFPQIDNPSAFNAAVVAFLEG